MGEERLPRTVAFGELVGGKGDPGGQEKDWIVRLGEDIAELCKEFEGWRKAVQNAGKCFSTGRGGVGGIHPEMP